MYTALLSAVILVCYWSGAFSKKQELIYKVGIKLCAQRCFSTGSCAGIKMDSEHLHCQLIINDSKMRNDITLFKQSLLHSISETPSDALRSTTALALTADATEGSLDGKAGQERLPHSRRKTLTSTTALALTTTKALALITDIANDPSGQQISPDSNKEKLTSSTGLLATTDAAEGPLGGNTEGPSHWIVCQRNNDCRIKKSICYRGVCRCTLGFYFSPKQYACLRACDEYGDEMDTYKGAAINRHNDKGVTHTTLTSCLSLCVRETAFTCLTVDWYISGSCSLSESGYLDVSYKDREHGLRNFIFGQRRCK